MTHEKWIKMTPTQQLVKIAKLCGWHDLEEFGCSKGGVPGVTGTVPWGVPLGESRPEPKTASEASAPDNWYHRLVPDYLNDLNAMYEAEELLGIGGQEEFQIHMAKLQQNGRGVQWYIAHSTASQRAEAFALTMEPE